MTRRLVSGRKRESQAADNGATLRHRLLPRARQIQGTAQTILAPIRITRIRKERNPERRARRTPAPIRITRIRKGRNPKRRREDERRTGPRMRREADIEFKTKQR